MENTITDRIKKKAMVEVETMSKDTAKSEFARKLVQDSGKLFESPGVKYLGSATVHIYEKPDEITPTVEFVTMAPLNDVHEVHAALGLDQLRKKLMASFGRKVKQEIW